MKFINSIFSDSSKEPLNFKNLKYIGGENGNPGNSHIHLSKGKSTFNNCVCITLFIFIYLFISFSFFFFFLFLSVFLFFVKIFYNIGGRIFYGSGSSGDLSVFILNSCKFNNCSISNQQPGGVISVEYCNLTIEDCIFENCFGGANGGICSYSFCYDF
jgi:hypothetical protein